MKPFFKKALIIALVGSLGAFVLVNVIARNQVRAMTMFVDGGVRTAKPESLSFGKKVATILKGVTVPRPTNNQTPAEYGLQYCPVAIPNGAGFELSEWVIASDDPSCVFLMFHGYAASKESLLPTAKALWDLGCSSVLVDFYGSGDSSGSGTTIGVLESMDVAASVEFARSQWPRSSVVLYGFSMGGAAILRSVAVDHVKPDAIILESVFDKLINAVGMRFSAMGLAPRPFADLLLFWGSRTWGFDATKHNPSDYAREVSCPCLLIAGDSDARVGPGQSEAIIENLRGPRKLVVISGMGHQNAISIAPEVWRTEVGEFLTAAGLP